MNDQSYRTVLMSRDSIIPMAAVASSDAKYQSLYVHLDKMLDLGQLPFTINEADVRALGLGNDWRWLELKTVSEEYLMKYACDDAVYVVDEAVLGLQPMWGGVSAGQVRGLKVDVIERKNRLASTMLTNKRIGENAAARMLGIGSAPPQAPASSPFRPTPIPWMQGFQTSPTPAYVPSSPAYAPSQPAYASYPPGYAPTAAYVPTAPAYSPSAPAYAQAQAPAPDAPQSVDEIIFRDRMKKSCKVQIHPDLKFGNNRAPHVETPQHIPNGARFKLGTRRTDYINGNHVVTRDVIGVDNEGKPAHLTVYFGPSASEAAKY